MHEDCKKVSSQLINILVYSHTVFQPLLCGLFIFSTMHELSNSLGVSGGSRISGRGVLICCCARSAREIFRGHAHFRAKPRPISIVLRQIISSSSPIDLFSKEFLLKHSKVSHSSSFLSSVARKRGSIYLTSVYFLVLGVAQRGVPVHPWIPLWIRHWESYPPLQCGLEEENETCRGKLL